MVFSIVVASSDGAAAMSYIHSSEMPVIYKLFMVMSKVVQVKVSSKLVQLFRKLVGI